MSYHFQVLILIIIMHQNSVYINAQGWIGILRNQNINNAGDGFWCPDWLAIFWRAYIHFSLVRVADLNSVLRANFGAYPETSCNFTSVLAVRNVSVLLLQFCIVTLHCVWQPS